MRNEVDGVVPQPDTSDPTGDGAGRSRGNVPARGGAGRRQAISRLKPLRERLAWRKTMEIFRPR